MGRRRQHQFRRLFNWYGTVDDCNTTNKLHLITAGGCFDALWGGSSGSAMYYIDTNRYVLGVASTSDRVSNAYYARFWDDGVNFMNDTFIPGTRGTDLDLQMLDFKADQSAITAGNSVTNASFVIANPSNSITVDIRASTNEIISTGDYQLGYYVLSGLAGSGTTTQSPTVAIPSIPAGAYYIGMIIDSSDDVDSSNNITHDAVAITVVNALIFANGFESGSTGSWDVTVP